MLKVGDKVKDFNLLDEFGKVKKLSNYLGKKVIIYIYQENGNPGCVRQALSFKDLYNQIIGKNAILIGLNNNSVQSNKEFKNEYELPFSLLSDSNSEIISYFGALQERYVFDTTFLGVIRSTFIIDEKGYLEKVWMPAISKVNPKEVLEYLNN